MAAQAKEVDDYGLGQDVCWWTEQNESRRAQLIYDIAGRLWRDHEGIRESMLAACRMYGNLPILGLSPRLYRRRTLGGNRRRLSLNVIKSVVDTYVSMICKDEPKVSFVTSGGDWGLQRRAKLLEKFVDGTNYDQHLYIQGQQIVRDSALFGIGFVKFFTDETCPEEPKIGIDRVLPWEILISEEEACYGDPQSLFHVKFIDKRVLMAEYPDKAGDIANAGSQAFEDLGEAFESVNLVEWCAVVEAWHLPRTVSRTRFDRISDNVSNRGSGDGRHSIVCGQVLLVDEPYEVRTFPFEMLYRQRPIQGIWGPSLADELAPIQVAIARLLQTIERSQIIAAGHWLVEQNSNVNTNAINDVIGSIIRYTGTKPEFEAFAAVDPAMYSHLDRLRQAAFEIVGVPQVLSQGQKPPGINSGKGLLVYADVTSQRFQPCYREYQDWFKRIAHQEIQLAREIAQRYPDYQVSTTGPIAGGGSMKSVIKWADANLRDEEFALQLYPTNKLADDPAARYELAEKMGNSNMYSPDAIRRLFFDMPDFEALNSYEDASYNIIMRSADEMINEGTYFPPERYIRDPQDAVKRMTEIYLKARLDRVPENRLELIRRWIDQCAGFIEAPPAQGAANDAQAGPTQASPGPQTPPPQAA